MNETILLPVDYLGTSHELPLTIVPFGYTYQLHIEIGGKTLIFEKDDEGHFRVIDAAHEGGGISKGLIAAVVETLEGLG